MSNVKHRRVILDAAKRGTLTKAEVRSAVQAVKKSRAVAAAATRKRTASTSTSAAKSGASSRSGAKAVQGGAS